MVEETEWRSPGNSGVICIEKVRKSLELTKSEFASLLKVDPASLSRWSREGSKVPPYILQSLEWYVELSTLKRVKGGGKSGSLPAPFTGDPQRTQEKIESFQLELNHWKKEALLLKQQIGQTQAVGLGWKLALLAHTVIILFYLMLKS